MAGVRVHETGISEQESREIASFDLVGGLSMNRTGGVEVLRNPDIPLRVPDAQRNKWAAQQRRPIHFKRRWRAYGNPARVHGHYARQIIWRLPSRELASFNNRREEVPIQKLGTPFTDQGY